MADQSMLNYFGYDPKEYEEKYDAHAQWDREMNDYVGYEPGQSGFRSDLYQRMADDERADIEEFERTGKVDAIEKHNEALRRHGYR